MNKDLIEEWLKAKAKENEAKAERKEIEDMMIDMLELDETEECSTTRRVGGYRVEVTQRLNRKVDSDKLQELAAQEGMSDHLTTLFRWKAELNKREWDSSDESITGPLSYAITTKASRPSFKINIIGD